MLDVVRTVHDVDHHVVVPLPGRSSAASGAVTDEPALEAMVAYGATLHRIDMRRAVGHPANPVAAVQLVRLVRRLHPDLLHGHSSVGGALARLAGPPTGRPVVYTPNGLATTPAALAIERVLGRITTRLVAVSESEGELAVQLGVIDPAKLAVIPNGIDLVAPDPGPVPDLRRELGLPPGTPLVGTVARLVDQKAPTEFVRVCAEVVDRRPDVHGLLIGMGPLQHAVDREVTESAFAGRFHQIHHLPHADAAIGQFDVFVLPSRFEGGPYTPLEAIRAGVPVVLSDAVGNRDVIEAERSGVLRAFGDTHGMATAVVELMDRRGHREAMVAAAADRLAERFDVVAMGAAVGALYRSVAAVGRGEAQ